MHSKISLDSNVFKALSAKSRVDILKHLNKRKYTQSELSQLMNIKVPSVKEHLNELEKAELVKKLDEGRKWKYYELTYKAKSLLHPEEKQIFIALGTFLLSAFGTGYLFWKDKLNLGMNYSSSAESYSSIADNSAAMYKAAPMIEAVRESPPALITQSSAKAIPASIYSEPNYLLGILLIVSLIALIFLVYFLIKRKKSLFLT